MLILQVREAFLQHSHGKCDTTNVLTNLYINSSTWRNRHRHHFTESFTRCVLPSFFAATGHQIWHAIPYIDSIGFTCVWRYLRTFPTRNSASKVAGLNGRGSIIWSWAGTIQIEFVLLLIIARRIKHLFLQRFLSFPRKPKVVDSKPIEPEDKTRFWLC